MIRTSYPISPIKQIRLRMELATRRTRRTLEQRRRSLLTQADRRKAIEGDVYLMLRWREDVKRARATYEEFYDQYDALIGLLCLAAHQGIEPHLEEEYRAHRAWFTANYPQRIKRLVEPYLPSASTETQYSHWGRRTPDIFEALYTPSSIAAVLEQDNGNLIGRMMRTQEALANWDAYLRQEEKTVAVPLRVC